MLDATALLRAYAGLRQRQLARLDPARAQAGVLGGLLRAARGTRFGRAHGFASIGSVRAYQRRVPPRDYEAFWREWWQPAFPRLRDVTWPGLIPFFALTSGTTGGPTKYIPVSRAMLRANRRAALDTLAFHLAARPRSRILGGRSFILGGSTALARLAPGVRAGDLSGIAAVDVPWWARGRAFPPRDLALIADWDRKVAALAPRSLAADVRSLSGTPSWLLLFLDRLAALDPARPRRLDAFYPDLELLVHGGVGFGPYEAAFAPWLAGSDALRREVYPASEGFIAVADRGPGEGLRLLLDNGLFYEFVRAGEAEDPRAERRWIGNAARGVNYALLISSNAGLWSYVLGDTVELVDLDPPRLLVTGRTAHTLSAFGEHLTGRELDAGIEAAARASGVAVTDYAAVPLYPAPDRPQGGHLFVVELSGPPRAVPEAFVTALDVALARGNADYTAHRSGGFGMAPPAVRGVPPGTFAAWMRARGRLGGQNKVPRVIEDPALLASLLACAGDAPGR